MTRRRRRAYLLLNSGTTWYGLYCGRATSCVASALFNSKATI